MRAGATTLNPEAPTLNAELHRRPRASTAPAPRADAGDARATADGGSDPPSERRTRRRYSSQPSKRLRAEQPAIRGGACSRNEV